MRTVFMSPKAWRPSPMPARSVEGAPSTIFSAVFISSKWTHSICLVAKFTGRSPVYTPASSQTPPRPSSRPRSASKPSDRRIAHPEATVRVINPFSPQAVSVWLAPLRTSFSRSNPYRPGGMLRVSSGPPVLLQEKFSPRSMLYHPAAKVIDRKPLERRPSRLSMHRWRGTASPLWTFEIVWNIPTQYEFESFQV